MVKRTRNYKSKNMSRMYIDYDYHDYLEMRECGLSDSEIAHELSIDDDFIKKLEMEVNRDN